MSGPDPKRVRDEDIVVAACSRADRAEQERLFAQCFKKPLPPRGLEWRYDTNPVGESISFVARPPGGSAISGYACSPRRAIVGGDESTAGIVGETGDVMTHPDWRKRGFFSRLDRAVMEEAKRRGWALAFGLPNSKSAHIFLELGWEEIGSVRPWKFLLKSDAVARGARARDGRWRAWLMPFDVRRCAHGRAKLDAARSAFRRALIERFDGEVDALSRLVERDFAFMLRRDAAFLNWRFLRAPSKLHRAIGVYEGTELAGYVVLQLPRKGAGVGYLVDVLGRDQRALHAALGEGLLELEREGASVVEATALDRSWSSVVLREDGFLAPKSERRRITCGLPHDGQATTARASTSFSNSLSQPRHRYS